MNDDPTTMIVEFEVNSETTTTDECLIEWTIRADDVRDGEPDTPAYAAALNSGRRLAYWFSSATPKGMKA